LLGETRVNTLHNLEQQPILIQEKCTKKDVDLLSIFAFLVVYLRFASFGQGNTIINGFD
jgi:hypothetical protein